MRSDKKKKADPKRDIDNFLSKFDEPENTAEYIDTPNDSDKSESSENPPVSKQTFQWQEVTPVKSAEKKPSKKNKSERVVTKDPAPSAIKVQRLRDEDSDSKRKSESSKSKSYSYDGAVEPQKASEVFSSADVSDKTDKKDEADHKESSNSKSKSNKKNNRKNKNYNKKKGPAQSGSVKHKANQDMQDKQDKQDKKKEDAAVKDAKESKDSPEVIIDEMFGESKDSKEHKTEENAAEEKTSSLVSSDNKTDEIKDGSEKTDKADSSDEKKESPFKKFLAFFSGNNASPVELKKEEEEEEEKIDFIEALTPSPDSKESDNTSPDSKESDDTSSEEISELESSEISDEDMKDAEEKASDSKEVKEDTGEKAEEDSSEDKQAEVSEPDSEADNKAAEKVVSRKKASSKKLAAAAAARSAALGLSNLPKEGRSLPDTDYIYDLESGSYRKTDLGKRKRIEHKVVEPKKRGLFRRRKKKEKKTLAQILFLKKNKNYDPTKGATYELNGKTVKNKPYKFSFLKLFRDFVIIGLLMIMGVAGAFGYIIYHAPVFNYDDIYATVATSSVVYNDEGKQIDNIYYTENRRIVKYEDMPESLIESFVAIEDKTFWKHHGFNFTRMIGAVISSITGHGQISGTSTITQQLARNIYLPEIKSERSITRKVQEMYYAARLEHAHTKEEIIEGYLNTIYLGFGCYGVNSAARTYFSKNVKDLSVLESASLAALPQAPDNYALLKNTAEGGEVSEDSKVIAKSPDKIVTNDISKGRRDLTLDLMLEQGLITDEEYKASYGIPVNDFIEPTLKSSSSNYAYFHDYLINTLISDLMEQYEMSYEEAENKVYTGGLQIYSTVDSKAQNTVAEEFKNDDNFPFVSAVYNQDGDGNILNNDGDIALYDYEDYFNEEDDFRLSGENDEVVLHDDGSVTINKGHNLLIYETDVDGAKDYSIEFKNYYIFEDEILYSTQGGYVNIPAEFKTADDNGNVTVSADFFNDSNYKASFIKDGSDLIIKDTGYSLGRRTRQPQAAMVIVGVGTGEVKAMVGGRQFRGEKLLNRAIGARQPGSSIKPIAVYGAALQRSYELAKEGKTWEYTNFKIDRQGTRGWGDYVTVHSSIEDERTTINGKYWPKNASGGYSGTNNFRTAIQNSINTCAVKLLMQLGAEYAINQVKKFGITTAVDVDQDSKVNDVNPAAMALGAMTQGVTPLEMALAYAAFPGGGKVNSPICYTKVLDRNGKVILEGKSTQTEALNEGVAWIMTDVLQKVVSRGICWGAAIDGIDVGGKTGTTNDEYDIWFDGFTPSYAAALWIGTDNNIDMGTTSFIATTTWSTIMSQIPKALEGEYREMPDNIVEKWGDYYTEGTEVGLSSWSYAAEKKKARDAAYRKWSSQRENHKHKVVDVPRHQEVEKEAYVIVYEKDENGNIKKDKNGQPIIKSKERDPSKDVKKWVEEEWHWEYDSGWRDGDFCYSFDGNRYCD